MIPLWAIRPLIYVGAAVAIAAGLLWLRHSIEAGGYQRGKADVEAQYQERDRVATKAVNDRIQELQTAAREAERKSAAELNVVADNYESKLRIIHAKITDDNRRVAAGFRLRDTGAKCASGGGSVPAATAAPGVSDGTAGAELSGSVTADLLDIAGECDAVVSQLGAAQQIIRADRK